MNQLRKVHPDSRSGVENGDVLSVRHLLLLAACIVIYCATLPLQGDLYAVSPSDLLISILYLASLAGVSSRAAILFGFYGLALDNKEWSRTDRRRIAWAVPALLVSAGALSVVYFMLIKSSEDPVLLWMRLTGHFLWAIIPFIVTLMVMKNYPGSYLKKGSDSQIFS